MASERQTLESKLSQAAKIANQTINGNMNYKDAQKKFTDSVKRYLEALKIYGGFFERDGKFKIYGENHNYLFDIEATGNPPRSPYRFSFKFATYGG